MSSRLSGPERRQAVVETACRVFAKSSYRGSTTAQIARETGVTEPVLYRHFASKEELYVLTVTHYLDELLNFVPDPNRPYVGAHAVAHKGGLHVAGVSADPRTFEHIDPAAVGNAREVLISELSGRGTVLQRAETTGVDLDAALQRHKVNQCLSQTDHVGHNGILGSRYLLNRGRMDS